MFYKKYYQKSKTNMTIAISEKGIITIILFLCPTACVQNQTG